MLKPVKRIGYSVAEHIKGMRVSRYLHEYLCTQWLSPDEIRAIQDQKLVMLIEHAYETVPMYRQLMDRQGVTPSDIRSVEDLPKLPILTKELIRANYPHNTVSSKFVNSKLVEMSSSGSTGEPFRYVLTNDEKGMKWGGLYRFWNWAGYEMGDRCVNLTAFPPRVFKHNKIGAYLEAKYSGILGLPANELYTSNADDYIKKIAAARPKMLRGYASSLYYLAQVLSERGVKIKIGSVCSTGETLYDFQRSLMESFYGCKVFDGYGGEGMEVAAQCDRVGGYHINAENVIVETVDSEGRPCGPGVEGQIVLTDLNHYSMPFIRYNIQDVAMLSDKTCSCGRGLPILEKLSGRLADIGITPSGKSINVHFFTAMFMHMAPKVKGFQVVQEKPDLFIVNAVPGEGFDTATEEIMSRTQDYVGSEAKVELRVLDEIPTTIGGKRRLFISKCGIQPAGLAPPERRESVSRRVAYLISMVKRGVPAFTYREIDVLRTNGFDIALFPLTYRPGPYMPKPDWPVFRSSPGRVCFALLLRGLWRPVKFCSLLSTALRTRTFREFALAMYFSGEMARWGAERIHCHFGDSKLYTGYYCSEWLDLPMTVTVHAYEIHGNPNPTMFRIAAAKCEKVVVQSWFNRDAVMRKLGVPEEKIALIRAHGDMSECKGMGSMKILMVGEFHEKKGHEILLSAVKKLGREDLVVWLVGEGPLDVPGMARKLGVDDRTLFLGMVGKDLLNILYDACDMFVLPSRTAPDGDMEGIPAVLMEAMSRGRPVISTRHAGIPELVEEILVDQNDIDGLAQAIAKLADDPELRDRLGKRNLEIVRAQFSDRAVLELGELFR